MSPTFILCFLALLVIAGGWWIVRSLGKEIGGLGKGKDANADTLREIENWRNGK